jgi:hypothetical protein
MKKIKKVEKNPKKGDNRYMKTVQHNVRWHGWLSNAIEEWRKRHGNKSFSDSVNYLLTCELERRGYKPEHFEPGIYEKIKLRNLMKYLPDNLAKKVKSGEIAGYYQLMEEANVIMATYIHKAEADDTKSFEIVEEIGEEQKTKAETIKTNVDKIKKKADRA